MGWLALAWLPSVASAVAISASTTPSTGVAGVSNISLTGSNFPSGSILPGAVNIHFASTCGGPSIANTTALNVVTVLASTRKVQFQVPAVLLAGTYFVTLDGITAGAVPFSSDAGRCSAVSVTRTSATLSACIPGSSLGLNAPVAPGPVTAVVPRGAWAGGTTGIRMVSLEGAGVTASLSTTAVVNSCAANPATGQSVCVSNGNEVYILNGAGVITNTLLSASNQFTSFSGGSCKNCGVAINALTNQAVINMGLVGPSGSGLQVLDLNTLTFHPPKALARQVSQNISIDPTRGYVLSPNENNEYGIIEFNSTTGVLGTEYSRPVPNGGEFDSAAEDCSTGIALSSIEFTSDIYIADLKQAVFTPGAPGSWTAPSQIVTLNGSFSAGTSGITVAPGSSHLAIVTGEFGGSSFAVLQLPAVSGPGTGTPNIVDYAYVAGICGVNAGLDPHTISAYTSGNNGRAYGVMASGGPPPDKLAVLDLAAILAAPRLPGTNTVAAPGGQICDTSTPTLVRFVAVP